MVSDKLSTNVCVKVYVFLNYGFKWKFSQWYVINFVVHSIPQGSGAVKRFLITTSVNQVLTANNKFQAAKRLRKMTG